MKASVIIASHEEGPDLQRTVASCVESGFGPDDGEIVVVDDASTDGSADGLEAGMVPLRVERPGERLGVAGARNLGTRLARYDCLVFLDGHSRPDPGALRRLVDGVSAWGGGVVITPALAALDGTTWQVDQDALHDPSSVDLVAMRRRWVSPGTLPARDHPGFGRYYESPMLAGSAFAVGLAAFDHVGGFDASLHPWGIEDLDLGVRCWMLGCPILHDQGAIVGHRSGASFGYRAAASDVARNTLILARKLLDGLAWDDWLDCYRRRIPPGDFEAGWAAFGPHIEAVDQARDDLRSRAVLDLREFVERYQIPSTLPER